MVQKLHFTTGIILLVFIVSHFAVHLFALAGPEAHNAALKAIQGAYRNPVIEPLLVAALLFQIGLGVRLLWSRWKERGKGLWSRLQLISGLYLVYFIVNHTTAALYTRAVGKLDTNYWWVSGPLLHPIIKYWFYPYYALAVLSIGIHTAAFLHFRGKARLAKGIAWAGVPIVLAYWLSFGGWLFPIEMKPDYRAFYDGLLSMLGIT